MRVRAAISAAILLPVFTATPALAVANGSDVPAGRYGFTAKLSMTGIPLPNGSSYSSYCSGSLIAPQWILTTGHCFHDAEHHRVSGHVPYPTTVTLGLTDETKQTGVRRSGVEVVQSSANDVALLKLDSPVTGITPLTVNRLVPGVGRQVTLTGWGSRSSTDLAPSPQLQEGTMQVTGVGPTTLTVRGVAPSPTTSACAYDSGAPYFVPSGASGEVLSVETNGPDCPHAGSESTARVDILANWIADETK